MANHLDLEEQEQLDQLKHFWQQYGNLITWVLIAILGSFAGWNFYQYWQRNQAAQAATMYDEVERVARTGDMAKLDRVLADMKDKFSSTTYAQQAGLIAAKVYYDAGNTASAKSALTWVADQSPDTGYQAIAKLRLAGVLVESKAYDEALQKLSGDFPAEFMALVADRKGDIYQLQGKKAEAVAEYTKAYSGLDERTEYRALVEVKLNALGSNPRGAQAVAALSPASTGAGK
jgi:predicted negative regulator of RcsB-dependent stress response